MLIAKSDIWSYLLKHPLFVLLMISFNFGVLIQKIAFFISNFFPLCKMSEGKWGSHGGAQCLSKYKSQQLLFFSAPMTTDQLG